MINPFKKTFHKKIKLQIKGNALDAFYAFHDKSKRLSWDTLISEIENLEGTAQLAVPTPGSVSWQRGKGVFKKIKTSSLMVQIDPYKLLSAGKQIQPAFPFEHWAASMKNVPFSSDYSELVYTYTFEIRCYLQFIPFAGYIVEYVFLTQTKKRFKAMSKWLNNKPN